MSEERVTFHVLLFSVLKQRVGKTMVTIAAPEGVKGGELLDLLSKQYPVVAPYRSVIRLAINQEYVSEDVVVYPGDEIALITPVSGG